MKSRNLSGLVSCGIIFIWWDYFRLSRHPSKSIAYIKVFGTEKMKVWFSLFIRAWRRVLENFCLFKEPRFHIPTHQSIKVTMKFTILVISYNFLQTLNFNLKEFLFFLKFSVCFGAAKPHMGLSKASTRWRICAQICSNLWKIAWWLFSIRQRASS